MKHTHTHTHTHTQKWHFISFFRWREINLFTITTKHTPPNSFSLLLLHSLNFYHVIFPCKYVKKKNPIQHIRVIIFDYKIVSNFMYSDVCVRVELTKTVCSSIVFISLSFHFLRSLCTYPAAFFVFAVSVFSLFVDRKMCPPFLFIVCVCVCVCVTAIKSRR